MKQIFNNDTIMSDKNSQFNNYVDSNNHFHGANPKIVHSEYSEDDKGRAQVIDVIECLNELNSTQLDSLKDVILSFVENATHTHRYQFNVDIAPYVNNSNWKRAVETATTYQSTTTYVGAASALAPISVLIAAVMFMNLYFL